MSVLMVKETEKKDTTNQNAVKPIHFFVLLSIFHIIFIIFFVLFIGTLLNLCCISSALTFLDNIN